MLLMERRKGWMEGMDRERDDGLTGGPGKPTAPVGPGSPREP